MQITHKFMCDRTVNDLRTVITLLEGHIKSIEGGDVMSADELFMEELPRWNELLALRFAFLVEHKGEELDEEMFDPASKQ